MLDARQDSEVARPVLVRLLRFGGCHAHRFGWACPQNMATQSRGHGTRAHEFARNRLLLAARRRFVVLLAGCGLIFSTSTVRGAVETASISPAVPRKVDFG